MEDESEVADWVGKDWMGLFSYSCPFLTKYVIFETMLLFLTTLEAWKDFQPRKSLEIS